MNFKEISILLLFTLIACAPEQNVSRLGCPDCNIILISVDTFRGDHLTCAGYDKYEVDITKNICDFSEKGILYTNAISQGSETLSSHASIMTSAILSHHNAFVRANAMISKDTITIAEVLKANGYKTAAFTNGGRVASEFGFSRGFDNYTQTGGTDAEPFSTITAQGLKWLNKTNGKFFLFLHTYKLHDPYSPELEDATLLDPDYNGTLGNVIDENLTLWLNNPEHTLPPEDLNHIIALYDAEILSVDRDFGAFLKNLESQGYFKNTIIILTSDHGEEFKDHGGFEHDHTLYNELLNVPLIFYAPNITSQVETKLVRSIDIAPTMLELLGIPPPETFEGRSLFIEGEVAAISEHGRQIPPDFAVQTKRWKYSQDAKTKRVFGLFVDPLELNNIINANPEIQANYTEFYHARVGRQKNIVKANLTDETVEQLKSLGYTT